ncbi:MAG: hypothetical protein JO072_10420 [Parafilimonas sp.]|nr:hypothetical protein [Parafilimonas sp.]
MITLIITILIAVIIMIVAISTLNKFKSISKNGIEVEGIVFDLQASSSAITNVNASYPIIRFLTKENEWITEKSDIGVIPGFYKSGEKLIIVYENGNPKNFYIKNAKSYSVHYIMIIIAIIFIIPAILKLIGVI